MFILKDLELERMSLKNLLQQLKKTVKLRNNMCGSMYWNVLNNECKIIANKCISLGCSSSTIKSILS